MTSETATIRVSRPVRDLLAAQARRRGISLAALLAEVAHEREAGRLGVGTAGDEDRRY